MLLNDPEDAAIARALQASLAKHNRSVALLTLLSVGVSLLLWAGLYFALFGLAVAWQSISAGIDARPPGAFLPVFLIIAFLSCLVAFIRDRFRPDTAPRDKSTIIDHLRDVLLMLPRVTLSVLGTLAAWQSLSRSQLLSAARLLSRLHRDYKVELTRLAPDLPGSENRRKVLLALQIVDLAYFMRTDAGLFLVARPEKVRAICEPRIRLAPGPRNRERKFLD